ncbi:MAG TPA: type II toxin-antitoxin system VapC family toxin [Candidatus Limnocylindria bacterium]|nr:type II toxin-antitoxin system VapC family toxin [Candidatus Limnocylindria bacterium]
MQLVADSSVITAVCLAGGQLGPLTGHEIHGPALLSSEVTSAIRERQFRAEIGDEVAGRAIAELASLEIRYADPGSLSAEAFALAAANGWAKTYDAEFVALARRLGCPIVTLDGRLQRGASHLASIVAPTELQRPGAAT